MAPRLIIIQSFDLMTTALYWTTTLLHLLQVFRPTLYTNYQENKRKFVAKDLSYANRLSLHKTFPTVVKYTLNIALNQRFTQRFTLCSWGCDGFFVLLQQNAVE